MMQGAAPLAFDRRALSRALSAVAVATVTQVLTLAATAAERQVRVIGITGAPGAGKSTLIKNLATARLPALRALAILAIDPTSPITEGSILGDRIRMEELNQHSKVYIRSLPSRSAEDGLTDNLPELIDVIDSYGFDELMIETVGAGQSAYGIRALADIEVLVLTPGAGDAIQAMKAGIMETADVFVVNKSDQPGADRVVQDLLGVMRYSGDKAPAPIVMTRADDNNSVSALSAAIDHAGSTLASQAGKHSAQRRYRTRRLLQRRIDEVLAGMSEEDWSSTLRESYARAVRALQSG